MEELIDLKKLKDIKCVKVFSKEKSLEMQGLRKRSEEANRQYFTCMYDDKKLVIMRSQFYYGEKFIAIANEEGLIGDFMHDDSYNNFLSKHKGIADFDYKTRFEFEDSLNAALFTYNFSDKNKKMEELLNFVHSSDVINRIYSDEFQKLEDEENKKMTVYKQVAKDALVSWNGLSEEEATKKVLSTKNSDLESEVYAQGSIDNAVQGIVSYMASGRREVNYHTVKNMVMSSPIDSHALSNLFARSIEYKDKNESKNWKNEMALSALDRIHDGWVEDNQKKFMTRDKKYQHMPIELIGWKEVKSDLLFLNPILQSMGINIREEDLEKTYDDRVKDFFKSWDVKSIDELGEQISKGASFYKSLKGQEDILQALKDPEFVTKTLIPSIKEKGIGADKNAMKRLEQWKNRSSSLAIARARKQELKKEAKIIEEAEQLIDQKENDGKGDINE